MTWLKNLFINKKNNQNEIADYTKNWYLQRTKDEKITQIVLSAPVSSIKDAEFGTIMLPYDKFPIISSQPWCTGYIRMSGKPVPYQMIRVDEFDEEVKKSDITIALSFCKLSSGGIFLIDSRIENPSISDRVQKRFPYLPPISKPVAEWVVSIEDSYNLEMMQDVFSSSELKIIVANSEGANTSIMDNDGNFIDCLGPCAHHDRIIPLDQKVIDLLKKELKSLLDYHNSIPYSRRDFQQANQELGNLLPFDKDPIIPN